MKLLRELQPVVDSPEMPPSQADSGAAAGAADGFSLSPPRPPTVRFTSLPQQQLDQLLELLQTAAQTTGGDMLSSLMGDILEEVASPVSRLWSLVSALSSCVVCCAVAVLPSQSWAMQAADQSRTSVSLCKA